MKKGYGIFSALKTIIITAVIVSTVLIFFSPSGDYREIVLSSSSEENSIEPTPVISAQTQYPIGIVSGHWNYDTGAVCGPDLGGVCEKDVNLQIAVRVRDLLQEQGYIVDLMQEFDPKLSDYTALALVAIHSGPCEYQNDAYSGFKVRGAASGLYPAEMNRFNECMRNRYGSSTGLVYRGDNIDSDNDIFYSYDMVNSYTTVSIIEAGNLNLDYRFISENLDKVSLGIADGIVCYINNEPTGSGYNREATVSTEVSPIMQTRFIFPGLREYSPAQ